MYIIALLLLTENLGTALLHTHLKCTGKHTCVTVLLLHILSTLIARACSAFKIQTVALSFALANLEL